MTGEKEADERRHHGERCHYDHEQLEQQPLGHGDVSSGITREVNARKSRTDQSWFRKGSEKVSGLETTFWADRALPQGQPVGTSSRRFIQFYAGGAFTESVRFTARD